jgi:hypothetical protein
MPSQHTHLQRSLCEPVVTSASSTDEREVFTELPQQAMEILQEAPDEASAEAEKKYDEAVHSFDIDRIDTEEGQAFDYDGESDRVTSDRLPGDTQLIKGGSSPASEIDKLEKHFLHALRFLQSEVRTAHSR